MERLELDKEWELIDDQVFEDPELLPSECDRSHKKVASVAANLMTSFGRFYVLRVRGLDIILCRICRGSFCKTDLGFILGAFPARCNLTCPSCNNKVVVHPWRTTAINDIIDGFNRMNLVFSKEFINLPTPYGSIVEIIDEGKRLRFRFAQQFSTKIYRAIQYLFDHGNGPQKMQCRGFKQHFWANFKLICSKTNEYLVPAELTLFNRERKKIPLPEVLPEFFELFTVGQYTYKTRRSALKRAGGGILPIDVTFHC